MERLPPELADARTALASELTRRDSTAASSWLEELPAIWADTTARWGLTLAGPARSGALSLVIPVTAASGPAALKLVSPLASAHDEATALQAFNGRGAVRLHDADLDRGALLLQWLPGPALVESARHRAAVATAGTIAEQLARATPPSGCPSLAARASGWEAQLRIQHAAAQAGGTAVPEEHYVLALDAVHSLADDTTPTLAHGDLSLHNIMATGTGQWVAIDPSLLTGTAAHDAHTVVRSWLPHTAAPADPAAVETELTLEFSRAAGVDGDRSLRLSHARYVSSAYWEHEHQGRPEDVERLRRVGLALGRSLLRGC